MRNDEWKKGQASGSPCRTAVQVVGGAVVLLDEEPGELARAALMLRVGAALQGLFKSGEANMKKLRGLTITVLR